MIPRTLHFIWVGDESKRPSRCIQSWIDLHPGWKIRIWGNQDLAGRTWFNRAHMEAMAAREWNGVADMMRWEILFDEGGVLVDADSVCLKALPDWILECEAFACWENELIRPGLIAAGYFGTVPRNPFLAQIIDAIQRKPTVVDRMAWASVGPLHLTEVWKEAGYGNLTILPSHFFIPRHFTGVEYTGPGPVYAQQEWGSTLRSYDKLADGGEPLAPRKAPKGQAFLFEPRWEEAEWVEVILSYLQAFAPGDPTSLVLILDPEGPGQISLTDAEQRVLQLVAQTGRERFPDLVLLDRPGDLADFLRPYPLACWVPPGMGSVVGFRGALGVRFAEARSRMAIR